MRLIEATFPDAYAQAVIKAVVRAAPVHWRIDQPGVDDQRALHALFEGGDSQGLIDAIQRIMENEDATWRVVVMKVEATVPALPKPEETKEKTEEKKRTRTVALREEIYQDVASGAGINADYLVLTALSTVVAAIGLNADNVAVVIGAMVIAPLLGPMLAFNFAAALGDTALLLRAARTAALGLLVGFAVSGAIGAVTPVRLDSVELMSRTVVGLDSVALALASGAAAALSIVTGLSMTLVGVMVAVALLPPAAAVGLFLGAGEPTLAARAALMLGVNVVCVNIAALVVYRWKGVAPRTWLERRSAKRSTTVNLIVWTVLLAALVAVIILSQAAVVD